MYYVNMFTRGKKYYLTDHLDELFDGVSVYKWNTNKEEGINFVDIDTAKNVAQICKNERQYVIIVVFDKKDNVIFIPDQIK